MKNKDHKTEGRVEAKKITVGMRSGQWNETHNPGFCRKKHRLNLKKTAKIKV